MSLRWGLVVLAWFPACFLDLKLKNPGLVVCQTSAQCPQNSTCKTAIQRCVALNSADSTAPTLSDLAIAPTAIGVAGHADVRFTPSEPLLLDAVVKGRHGNDEILFVRAADGTYGYDATGREAEGDYDVEVYVSDVAGNDATVRMGQLTLDFTPPTLGDLDFGFAPGQTAAGADQQLDVTAATEADALVVDAVAVAADGSSMALNASVQEARVHAPLSVAGLGAVADFSVTFTVSDPAGNRATKTSTKAAIRAAPPSDATAFLTEGLVSGAQTVHLNVSATDAAQVEITGDVLPEAKTFAWVPYQSTFTLTLTAGDGAKTVSVRLRDTAFNETDTIDVTTELRTGAVTSAPQLLLPVGQTQLRDGTLLLVAGTGEPGATVEAARLVNVSTQATVQTVSGVSIDALGQLSGGFIATGLTHGTNVALEVVLRARSVLSIAANSRSLPVFVNTTPPSSTSVSIAQGATTSLADIDLSLFAIGAAEMFIDGDLVDGPSVRTWLPFAASAAVRVTSNDGYKAVAVRFRSGSFAETLATTATTYDTAVPSSSPVLVSPWGVSKVKNGDPMSVAGHASLNTTLVSAKVVSLDGTGAPLVGAGCAVDVTPGQVTLTNGDFSGTVNVGTPCVGAVSVALQAIVKNGANTPSPSGASYSLPLTLDNAAPSPASATLKLVGLAETGYTATQASTLLLAASEPDASAIEVLIQGDLQAGARIGAYVPFPGTEVVSGEEPITLTTGDGAKTVTVKFRDVVHNETGPIAVAVTLLANPPSAPTNTSLRLAEVSPAPNTAAQIADTNNTLTLTGLAGAVPTAAYAEIYSSAALGAPNLLATKTVATGGFSATVLPYNSNETYWVVARDRAGNRSASTAITMPRFDLGVTGTTMFKVTPSLAKAGTTLDIQFSTSAATLSSVAVTVAGQNASFVSLVGSVYHYSYVTTGSETPQGSNQAVVRVTANDATGSFASGTVGTDAIVMSLDFTAPTLDPSKVVVGENAPGVADTIAVQAAGISDNVSPASTISVEIFKADGITLLTAGVAASDGSFVAYGIGDNLNSGVVIKLTDQAGNKTAGAPFPNDITAPTLTAMSVTPAAQRSGQTVSISFNLADVHDLIATPAVMVGATAATFVSGTLNTSNGLVHPFVYTYTVAAGDGSSTKAVTITAVDTAGNTRVGTTSLITDSTLPISVNTSPGNKVTWNASPAILGTASDNLAGVALVEVSVKRLSDNKYWNGSTFSSASEVFASATGTTTWQYAVPPASFTNAVQYTIRYRATDNAGNVESPLSWTFTYDSTLPAAPTLTATSTGRLHIDLSWTAVGGAASYKIYYALAGSGAPPYGGTGATEGASPITVAGLSTAITNLPRGSYVFAVTTVDGSARESGYSAQQTAASRSWEWKNPTGTAHTSRKVISPAADVFVAVGEGGYIAQSSDGGQLWSPRPLPFSASVTDIASAGGVLVAVGFRNLILRSTNFGVDWTKGTGPASLNNEATLTYLTNVVGRGSSFFAYGMTGGHLHSQDSGATWAAPTTPLNFDPYILVASTNNLVAIAPGKVSTSPTGAVWTVQAGAPASLQIPRKVVAEGHTLTVLCESGEVWRSLDDGVTWGVKQVAAGISTNGLAANGANIVVTANNGRVYTSNDSGVSYQLRHSVPGQFFTDVAVQGNTFVAGSYYSPPAISSSDAGVTWSADNVVASPAQGRAIAGSNGKFVIVGDYGHIVARDTLGTWTRRQGEPTANTVAAKATNAWLHLGTAGYRSRSTDNAVTWSSVYDATTRDYTDVSCAGVRCVATATDGFYTSGDSGATWNPVMTGSPFQGVWNDGTHWVVVASATSYTSNDGIAFTPHVMPAGAQVKHVSGVTSTVFAYGDAGQLWRSTNLGVDWTQLAPPYTTNFTFVWTDGTNLFAGGPESFGSSANGSGVTRSTNAGDDFTRPIWGASTNYYPTDFWTDGTRIIIPTGQFHIACSTNFGVSFSTCYTSTMNEADSFNRVRQSGNEIVVTGSRILRTTTTTFPTWTHDSPALVAPNSANYVITNGLYSTGVGSFLGFGYGGAVVEFGPP